MEVSEISFEPRAKEDRSIIFQKNSKSSADRGVENQFVKKFKTLCERGKEQVQISDGREFEVQNPSENSKPCTERGQNIR